MWETSKTIYWQRLRSTGGYALKTTSYHVLCDLINHHYCRVFPPSELCVTYLVCCSNCSNRTLQYIMFKPQSQYRVCNTMDFFEHCGIWLGSTSQNSNLDIGIERRKKNHLNLSIKLNDLLFLPTEPSRHKHHIPHPHRETMGCLLSDEKVKTCVSCVPLWLSCRYCIKYHYYIMLHKFWGQLSIATNKFMSCLPKQPNILCNSCQIWRS